MVDWQKENRIDWMWVEMDAAFVESPSPRRIGVIMSGYGRLFSASSEF